MHVQNTLEAVPVVVQRAVGRDSIVPKNQSSVHHGVVSSLSGVHCHEHLGSGRHREISMRNVYHKDALLLYQGLVVGYCYENS